MMANDMQPEISVVRHAPNQERANQDKADYILAILRQISHKPWELFVISRIIHLLSDDDIEFITQQYVRRPDGRRALTDLYFPQLNLHLEIDEPHHLSQQEEDALRERDIVQQTHHQVERIPICSQVRRDDGTLAPGPRRPLSNIRQDIDSFVQLVARRKAKRMSDGQFEAWDLDNKYDPNIHIKKGYIDERENVVFRNQVDALRCFGFTGKGWQKAAWTIPDGTKDLVWFPRLYAHNNWLNSLEDDGRVLLERATTAEGVNSIAKQKAQYIQKNHNYNIVFAKAKDAFGQNLLRYVGTFKVNLLKSTENCLRFDLVRTREDIRVCKKENAASSTKSSS